jgi:hypothetical protein
MVDTPTTNYGLRTQELGSNIATWGDPNLNEVENCIDQILGKVKDIAITGDYTITSTNYVTTADNKNRGWRFTGTLTALATITVPATHTSFVVVNDTTGGFSLTVKTSSGTGITVPNGRTAWLRCNATNVLNAFPTHMGTTFVPSLSGDAANVSFVETAIATASLPATAGTVLVSGGDTTAGYLGQKLAVAGDLALSIQNPAGDENSLITHTPYWNAPRYVATADSPVAALDRDVIFVNTTAAVEVDLPASGRVWIIDRTGNAPSANITVDPPGADTTTIDTIDLAYFSAVFTRNATTSNWDIS